jgi:hypothetical protein
MMQGQLQLFPPAPPEPSDHITQEMAEYLEARAERFKIETAYSHSQGKVRFCTNPDVDHPQLSPVFANIDAADAWLDSIIQPILDRRRRHHCAILTP